MKKLEENKLLKCVIIGLLIGIAVSLFISCDKGIEECWVEEQYVMENGSYIKKAVTVCDDMVFECTETSPCIHPNIITFDDDNLSSKGLDLNINQHQIIFGGGHGTVNYNSKTGEINLVKNYTGIMYHPNGQQLMSVGGVLTINGNTQEVFDWSFVIDASQNDYIVLTAVPNEGYSQIIIEENGETSFLYDGNAQFTGQGSQAIGFLELSYDTFYTTTLGVGFGIVQALTDIQPNFEPGGEDTPPADEDEDLDPGEDYEDTGEDSNGIDQDPWSN